MEALPRQPGVPVRRPPTPFTAAVAAAGLTAGILTTLGALSLVTAGHALEREAGNVVAAGAAAAAGTLDAGVVRAALAGDSAAPSVARLASVVAATRGAVGMSAAVEVYAIRGDSMVVVADDARPSRGGQADAVPSDARAAWSGGRGDWRSRVANGLRAGDTRVLAAVREPDGVVVGVVAVSAPAVRPVGIRGEFRSEVLAGIAVIVGLTALAGIAVYRVEAGRRDTAEQLVAAKESAEATARARGSFLANMSHEIRTPLHGVLGMTEALLATPHTEADRRSLAVINRSASSLLGILNDILDYSKLEAGRIELLNAPFDPRALVDDVTDLFAVRAEEKGLDLAVDEKARCDQWPVGDAARIRQVLLNLVGNAVKFTERGSVRVELSTVTIGRKTVMLRIAVCDTGIGIAPDVQDRVFEQFAQAESSTARRFGGTGLGLTISRQLVLLMGGTISISSRPGSGSEFAVSIQLPAAPSRQDLPAVPPFAVGERVVLCTHGAATFASLSDLCARDRLTVVACASVAEVERLLKRGERTVAVFCDATATDAMPHPLGGGPVPLVLLTTVHHPLNNSTLAMLGAAAQLRKPVRQDHFSALVTDLAAGRLRIPSREQPVPDAVPTGAAAAAPVPGATVGAAPAAVPTDPTRESPGPRVMVVDDVDLNLIVARAMLGSLGVQVSTASGGEEALELLAREAMDLVLMDCHMPGIDGYDVTKFVRGSHGPNRETPIVALSASAFAEDRERALASGMNDFATKPIELESLRGVLARWTARAAIGDSAEVVQA